MAGVQLPVAQYFARLGFVKDGFRAVLAGYIHKPELLEAIVDGGQHISRLLPHQGPQRRQRGVHRVRRLQRQS